MCNIERSGFVLDPVRSGEWVTARNWIGVSDRQKLVDLYHGKQGRRTYDQYLTELANRYPGIEFIQNADPTKWVENIPSSCVMQFDFDPGGSDGLYIFTVSTFDQFGLQCETASFKWHERWVGNRYNPENRLERLALKKAQSNIGTVVWAYYRPGKICVQTTFEGGSLFSQTERYRGEPFPVSDYERSPFESESAEHGFVTYGSAYLWDERAAKFYFMSSDEYPKISRDSMLTYRVDRVMY